MMCFHYVYSCTNIPTYTYTYTDTHRQAYYEPALTRVLDMLLDGDSALRHVRVPRDFDGKSYGELFEHLLLYVKERERG